MRVDVRGTRPPRPAEEKIAEIILGGAAVGSVVISPLVGLGVAAFLLAVGTTGYFLHKKDFSRESKRLKKRGYVALTKTDKGWLVTITKKGQRRFQQIKIRKMTLPRPKRWDGKWRLFVFDVPEKFSYSRNAMRDNLKRLGFYNIQRSVLAYPHACREEVELIADYYGLEEYTTYIETSFIDIDSELRKHFHL